MGKNKEVNEVKESTGSTSKFYDVSEDTVNIFLEIVRKKVLNDVSFQFIGCSTQKAVAKISKLPEQYEYMLRKHVIVSINEELMTKFVDEDIDILFEQEIDKISFNVETGKIKLRKTDINTFSALIKKWGIEKISRANQIVEILSSDLKVNTDFENNFVS